MNFSKISYVVIPLFLVTAGCGDQAEKPKSLETIAFNFKPNILWISVEDIGCQLPMYGDSTVYVPNLQRLAAEGVVFDNAYTVAGVCAPSRSSIITGMYPTRMGTHNMRTTGIEPPSGMVTFPTLLREQGYYCTNNLKEDYNFSTPGETWDESSHDAHFKNRQSGQPFFAVFNSTITHESKIWALGSWNSLLRTPSEVPVPSYYPEDNFLVKKDLARNYSNIMLMDAKVGDLLHQLEAQELMNSTIIVFWSDHGGPLPRQKRELYNSGIKVPLIVRFPDKLLAGTREDKLVSLMDLGPTMLAMAGIEKPEMMNGKVFIGPKTETRENIYAARDRMDAQYELVRAASDGQYKYIRNYYPERPNKQIIQYRLQIPMMRELNKLDQEKSMDKKTAVWFRKTKPVEELYNIESDPDELLNLASDLEYAEKLEEMREVFLSWQQSEMDLGLIPEAELFRLQEKHDMPVYDFLQKTPHYFQKVQEAANKSLFPDANQDVLLAALNDTIPSVRFWAAKGLGNATNISRDVGAALKKLKQDEIPVVKVAAAYALIKAGEKDEGITILEDVMRSAPEVSRAFAANMAGSLPDEAIALKSVLLELVDDKNNYVSSAAKSSILAIERNANQ